MVAGLAESERSVSRPAALGLLTSSEDVPNPLTEGRPALNAMECWHSLPAVACRALLAERLSGPRRPFVLALPKIALRWRATSLNRTSFAAICRVLS